MKQKLKMSFIFTLLASIYLLGAATLAQADIDTVTAAVGTTTVNTASTYTITFNTGSSGALTASSNDTIDISFPSNTTVPATITSGPQITVNGNNITTSASGSGQVLTITTPIDIGNSSAVTIVINTGGNNIINPSIPISYTVDVRTNIESNYVTSSTYNIVASSTPVSVGTISANPSVVGQASEYTVNFTTSSDGALLADTSIITLTFDAATTISNGAISGVEVEGVSVFSATGNSGTRSISLIPSQDIGNNYANVTVVIPSSAIINPYSTGSYSVSVVTRAQPSSGSNTVSIVKSFTSVNVDSVSIPTNTIGNTSSYNIQIDIAADGELSGTSTITITFPGTTAIPDGAIAGVTVEGTPATTAVGNSSGKTITVDPGQSTLSGSNRNIVIPSGIIRNPLTVSPVYNLAVITTAQPTGNSPNYSITTSSTTVNVTSVTPSPATISNPSQYTIDFDTASDGALVGDVSSITVTFPAATTLTDGALTGVTVEGVAAFSATGNDLTHKITIVPNQDISGNTSDITLVIPSTAITNPPTANNYTLTVETSVQTNAGTSPQYALGASTTPINVDSVVVLPSTIGNIGGYTIQFDLAADGGLSGSDTITVSFPNDTEVLTSGSISGVTVNGTPVTSANGSTAADTITIDPAQDLAGGTNNVVIVIPSGSNAIRNPTTINSYSLDVETSLQPTGSSPNYAIGQSATALNVGNVTANPDVVGNQAAYTINFTTSSDGALINGVSSLVVTFPVGTAVQNGAISGVLVGGLPDSSATGNSAARTVTIVIGTTIGTSSASTIYIPAAAIRNPAIANNYTLTVSSSVQPLGTSNNYTIGQSATTLNVGSVNLNRSTIGNPANYTISVTTSSDGALIGGTSNFVVTFPNNTVVPNGAISNVLVDGISVSSATGNSGSRTVTIVPQQNINANDSFNIVIGGDQLINPTTASSYSLTVSTSAQPAGTSSNYSIGTSSTQLDLDGVLVSPSTIGNQGQYTISVTLASDGRLFSGSSILLTFPNDTLVTNGAIGGVTVNGFAATSATGNSGARTISIVVGTAVARGATFNIVVPAAAVRNPTSAGSSYTITGSTTVQPITGTSNTYTIGQSATAVNVTGVTPSPNTVGNPSTYTINFTTSSDGALLNGAGQTIIVSFPGGTSIANGSLVGVLLNGSGTTATGSSPGRTVTIVVNQDIAVSTGVTLTIPSTAITNPVAQNNYQLTVETTIQPAGSSPQYFIGASTNPMTVNSVTPTPSTVGNSSAYTISITTSSDGALIASTSSIIVTFPNDTLIPDGPLTGITLNGLQDDSATGSSAGRTITIVPGADINGSTIVSIVIPLDLNGSNEDIRNPTSTGNFTLDVGSSAQPAGTSPLYAIGQSATSINVTSVLLSSSTVGSDAQYTINFNSSADGNLIGDASQIIVTFPNDTIVTNGALPGITVNGTAAFSAFGNSGSRSITIVPDQDITGPNSIAVLIPSPLIQNPTNAGAYTLTLSTTPQPAGNGNYNITISGSPIAVGSVSLTTAVVSQTAGYTANVTTDTVIRSARGSFFMIFPINAVVPNGLIAGVTIGGAGGNAATGDASSRTITITPGADVVPGTFNLTIPDTTIVNPSIPGVGLSLAVSSTAQTQGSNTFTLTPAGSTLADDFNITVTPSEAGQAAEYQLNLTTGSNGRLGPGNVISIELPVGTTVPASLASGTITVDGIGTTGTTYSNGQVIAFMVPTGVNINSSTAFVVRLLVTANVVNPSAGVYQINDVHSDAEPTPVQSILYEISADSQINPPTVTLNPDSIFANSSVTVEFVLGSSGSLTQGVSTIFLQFPSEFTLPSSYAASNVTVNDTPVSIAAITNGDTFAIRSPIAISAGSGNKLVTVVFTTGVGILNPNQPGSFTINGSTSFETTPVASAAFDVTAASTTISQPNVNLFPTFTGSKSRMIINFNVGLYGRLQGNLSTIMIEIPSAFQIPSGPFVAGSILVNNTPTTASTTITGQILTVPVPTSIDFGGAVTLEIPSSLGILNPVNEGSHTFTLYTSTEPTPISSNSIAISRATWDDVVTYPNPLIKSDSVNNAFTWLFIPEQQVTLRLYTIDGRLVKKIVKEDNSDRIVWDLHNERGSEIASGVYIYIIKGSTGEKKGKIAYKK